MYKYFLYLIPFAVATVTMADEPRCVAPQELCLQIQEEKLDALLEQKGMAELVNDLDPHWIHQVAKVEKSGREVVLEDGSIWRTTWWGHFWSSHWNEGDVIVLVMPQHANFGEVKLLNITRESSASGWLWKRPKADSPNLRWIASLEDHSTTVVLNDGCRVKSSYLGIFRGWKEGDVVITLEHKAKKTTHALWNVMERSITWELTVAD